MSGLIVDLFAGGGGASLGIEWALGRSPDVAVNHSADAVAMHAANHPGTHHLQGNVWDYAPREVTGGRPVELLHASPTCTFFSRAKGAPLDRREAAKVRSLAWVVTRWAKEVQPRVITLENVEAFEFWGPLTNEGKPCPKRRGFTFRRWVRALEREGYAVEWRNLRACDYGAPTTRERLFVVARCDGSPIVWPNPTHGTAMWEQPYRTAAECIDWSIPCPSIFERARPLADATMRRVARGIRKFVLEARRPFAVPDPSGSGLLAPSLIHQSNGERVGQAPRIYDIGEPLRTVVAGGVKHGLVAAFLAKAYGGNGSPGSDLGAPMGTITTQDHHHLVEVRADGDRREEVRAFLTKFYGTSTGQDPRDPLATITTKDRFGLVTIEGHAYEIRDIGMRMLAPRELFRAQGFPDSYRIDMVTRTAQVRCVGNSVAPQVIAALVRANFAQRAERRVA